MGRLVAMCWLLATPASLIAAQAPVGSAGITGRVVDAASRQPIPGAVVQLRALDRSVETDSLGQFSMSGLPGGFFAIRVIRIGYAPVERNLNVTVGRVARVEYALAAEAAELPDVVVAGKPEEVEGSAILAGFEERRRSGGGVFLDGATLARWATREVSDVLRGTANLRLIGIGRDVKVASNRQLARSMRSMSTGRPCYLDILVDGQLIWSETRDGKEIGVPPDIDDVVSTFELAAAEIYMSTAAIPLKYRSIGNSCGAVMFWTKRGLPAGEPPA